MHGNNRCSRRSFLHRLGTGIAAATLPPIGRAGFPSAFSPPTSPVAIARCRRYDFSLIKATLANMFDQVGDVRNLVKQKTVTIKVNLTGGWSATTFTLSAVETIFTHPLVTLAACALFNEYGARRIIIAESLYTTAETKLSYQNCGYDVKLFESTIPNLIWEDTHNLGAGGVYRSLPVGPGAYLYSSFQFNHRYVDTDVMVSIPKMKNHLYAGVTLAMKNLFGSTPSALYSSSLDNEATTSSRENVLHKGMLSAAGGEILPLPSTDPGFRIPRAIVDIVRARPIDLSIIDGIVTMHGGEGPWHNTRLGIAVPNLLIVGRNPVCTDAITAAIMGYDPDAQGGTKPFYNGSNHIHLAAESGIGTNRIGSIDVIGLSMANARYTFQPTYKSGESQPY